MSPYRISLELVIKDIKYLPYSVGLEGTDRLHKSEYGKGAYLSFNCTYLSITRSIRGKTFFAHTKILLTPLALGFLPH